MSRHIAHSTRSPPQIFEGGTKDDEGISFALIKSQLRDPFVPSWLNSAWALLKFLPALAEERQDRLDDRLQARTGMHALEKGM